MQNVNDSMMRMMGEMTRTQQGQMDALGGQLRAGLTLRDVYGDIFPQGRLGQFNVPTFWATLSIKE